MKNVRCEEHSARYYTNYCGAEGCNLAVCPECLPVHLRQRRCDIGFLEPIEAASQRARINGDRCHKELVDQVALMRNRQAQLVADSHQRNQLALTEYRKKIEELVQRHFDLLGRKMKALELEISNNQKLLRTLSKYDNFRAEVDRMRSNLDNGIHFGQALRMLVGIDLKSFTQNIKSETQFVSTQIKPPLLDISPTILQELTSCLEKGINFKQNVTLPVETVLSPGVGSHLEVALNFSINEQPQEAPRQSYVPRTSEIVGRHSITSPQYFSADCEFNLLHSFEPLTKYLYIVPLEILNQDERLHIHRSELNIVEATKVGAKSLITPYGEIFAFGGRNPSMAGCDPTISKLVFSRNEFAIVGAMHHAREDHCVCYCNGYVYILNGQTKPNQPLRFCERFNIRTGVCEELPPTKLAVSRATACSFNGKFIFRFSGVDAHGIQVGTIERLDIRRNTWDMINASFGMSMPPSLISRFTWKPECMAIQINSREILFTCSTPESSCSTGTAVLTEIEGDNYEINDISLKSLPTEGYFHQPVIYNQIVHVIQLQPNKRKYNILLTDSNSWTVLS